MFCCKKTYRLIWLFISIRILVKQFYFMVSVKLSDLVSVEEVDVFGRLSGYLGVKDYSRVYSINFTDGGGVYVTLSNGGFRKDLGVRYPGRSGVGSVLCRDLLCLRLSLCLEEVGVIVDLVKKF